MRPGDERALQSCSNRQLAGPPETGRPAEAPRRRERPRRGAAGSRVAATGKPVVPYTTTYIRPDLVERLEESGQKLVIESLDAEDYNNIAHQLGVDYIFNSVLTPADPGWEETNSLQMEPIYREANNNPELFTLIRRDSHGASLWRVN